jgi:hypothetical protein
MDRRLVYCSYKKPPRPVISEATKIAGQFSSRFPVQEMATTRTTPIPPPIVITVKDLDGDWSPATQQS